ncbi:MAG TPA: GFA family protein, partial [Candidatus Udaeobacter sp.]|nr:GFA family protein [Candidatus Udaeobacter sp.]
RRSWRHRGWRDCGGGSALLDSSRSIPNQESYESRHSANKNRSDKVLLILPGFWHTIYRMAEKHTGQCYCGAVEIEMRGDPLEMGYCHCENCRHYSAAPVSAFTLWKKENVNVTKGEEFLGRFKSSDISERGYCTKCAGHILVEHPTLGLMDVRIGAPRNFPFKPAVHLNYAETILPIKDGLLKLKDFPAEIGGSGEKLPE